ncbi:import inner membrane translocase subunit tim-21 [Nannizzia gypsea CBS 118893]|uniref:Mitochondrial import inner membrane translocase subunit Tim21 n=1 Tax=Arthroderma gypseum (strain ATCC MYA-4604 / CBS 118893) TaxID=535722 RepID=E4V511_ARTGP|nr:import inner membrane translocase subunit tim-21 [Nannizzia gypsea CBS 118893]EFR05085.1 import inner membrane translocase subunit tim-21 [Nannizzia gypsea CBS 118893]
MNPPAQFRSLRPESLFLRLARNGSNSSPVTPVLIRYSRYATQSSLGGSKNVQSTRKSITVASDDGTVKWGQLSRAEKVARATQQSVNFLVIVAGAVMTCGVFTFLYLDVFAPDSKTNQFNRAVNRVKESEECLALLGDSKQIRAYGETSWNKWTRNRPIATTIETDRKGNEHMRMNFHVSGPLNDGVVLVHLVKLAGQHDFEYHLLALDVKGHRRVYLENADAAKKAAAKAGSTIFGIQWR